MRPDFRRVIISRPRIKSWKKLSRKKFREEDEIPISIKKQLGWNKKQQSDLINPLRRFLRKNVGRKWNDVWSEICVSNDRRTISGSHLRDHVQMEVEQNRLYSPYRFYVDENGILQEWIRRKTKRTQRPAAIIHINETDYFCHNGLWYRVKMKDLPENIGSYYIHDVFFGAISSYSKHTLQVKYGAKVYCYWKEQAGKKEIREIRKINKVITE